MTKLSECEEQIMSVVWSSKETPGLKEIMVDANKKFNHEWAPQTVSTFLQRMVKKGFLNSTRKGRSHYYSPVVSLEEYRREQIRNIVDVLYGGDVDAAKSDLR